MRITSIQPDIHVAIGEAYGSNATAYLNGDEVLLVDAMGSIADANDLRRWIERDLGKRLRFIVSTHYFSDHLAALRSFPGADIIAHALYMHTWASEQFRSREEEEHFAPPTITFDDRMTIHWGNHTLELFHNPGHTMSTIGVDVASADLLHVGDTIVGNIAYIRYSPAQLLGEAIERARQRQRRLVLTSHGVPRDSVALQHAKTYLQNLVQKSGSGSELSLEDCLAPGIVGTEFERIYHGRNVETLRERAA